jgi:alpha-galactosidase
MTSHRIHSGTHRRVKRAKLTWKKKVVRGFILILGILVALAVIGNLLPQPKAHAAQPPVAERPVMGYNTWYEFGAAITEAKVLSQASLLVKTGLAAPGYNTVVIDDGWQGTKTGHRGSTAALVQNTTTFPHGMMWLARQLHGMGLKFGVYTAIGANTCTDHGGLAGSFGHYAQDAATFKLWGADFVKVDSCKGLPAGTSATQLTAYFAQFGAYIRAKGMTYSEELPVLMPAGSQYITAVAKSSQFANMWRVAPDESPLNPERVTVIGGLLASLPLYPYARFNHWNDLDLLVPGNPDAHPFGWTLAQEQSQVAVWAQEASPLILSTDIAKLSAAELAMLKNPHIVNIDQSGSQAPVWTTHGHVTAVVKGADGGMSLLLANTGTGTASAAFTLPEVHVNKASASILNVWTGATGMTGGIRITLPPGGTALYILK